jgi:hypothetical protein
MAYRKIHHSFWTDPDIESLTPEQKYFYLWLITNPAVNQIGLYEFSVRRASFETGYNAETIEKLISHFEKIGKIKVSKATNEMLVCKMYFHNKSNSPKVVKHVQELLKAVKNKVLIQYIYSMDIESQEEEVQYKTQVQEEAKVQQKKIIINDTIETRDRETLSVDDFQILHEKLSNIARQRGAMNGISESKIEAYITKRAKNNWQYKQGNGMVKINENNIGFDMNDMNRNGYLSTAIQETENTFNGGVMN